MIATVQELAIDIGGMPILVRTDSADYAAMLAERYGEFVSTDARNIEVELEIRIEKDPGLGTRDSGLGTEDSGSEVRSPRSEVAIQDLRFKIQDHEPALADSRQPIGDKENRIANSEFRIPNPESADFGPRTSDIGLSLSTPESRPTDSDVSNSDDPYDIDLSVRLESGLWIMERGDFRAEWNPETKRGWVRTTVNQYSIDGVLRILHSLILAREGGLLVHGASVVRNGRAFVFAGISGTGKTTISRLAPEDVTLLTDEISYIRGWGLGTRDSGAEGRSQESEFRGPKSEGGSSDPRFKIQDSETRVSNSEFRTADSRQMISNNSQESPLLEPIENPKSKIQNPESRVPSPECRFPSPQPRVPAFQAFGTPFAGELARIGVKTRAPLAGLFLLQQGPENRIEPVSQGQAVRELMRHILFFAHDQELVELVFQTVCDFVKRVPVRRLVFKKDASVWELIG